MKKYFTLLIFWCGFFVTMYSQPTKVVLIEEGTGTWCQWCPRGDIYGQTALAAFPEQVIFIAIHEGDPMQNLEYFNASGLSALPNGNIDRVYSSMLSPSNVNSDLAPRLAVTPPAGVSVSTTFDTATRSLTMTVSATFAEAVSGDWRLAAIVVEDGVTGPPPNYDQSNSYSGGANGPMGGYENLPSPVPASIMVYNHVGRYLAGGYDGDANSLPSSIQAGETHEHTYEWTLPEEYNEEYIQVVGVLLDSSTGEVVNAGKSSYLPGFANGKPFFHSQPQEEGFVGINYKYEILAHDPEHDFLEITNNGSLPNWLTINDLGDGKAELLGVPPAIGSHNITLVVSDGDWDIEQNFELVIGEPQEDWLQIGEPGFSAEEADHVKMAISNDGTPFVLSANFNGDIAVYKFVNDAWEKVGNSLQGNAFHIDMALSPVGEPYVFSEGILVKFNGVNWENVNTFSPSGIYPAIAFGSDGTPFVTHWVGGGDSFAWHFDGANWVATGNGMLADGAVVWTKMKTSNNGLPIAIYGTDGQNIAYSEVAEFDGAEWNVLGSGYVEPVSQTYFDHDVAVSDDGEIYAALTIGVGVQQLNIYQLVNDTWELHSENIAGGATAACNIEVDNEGNLIVAFRDENLGGKTTVLRYQNGAWNSMGIPGFTPIAADQSLAMNADGIPFVAYSDESENGKASAKQYVDLSVSILSPEIAQQDIRIFPNPNQGVFFLEFEKGDFFQIMDLQGRIISEGNLNSNFGKEKLVQEIAVENIFPGIYFLKIIAADGIRTVKFLVEE